MERATTTAKTVSSMNFQRCHGKGHDHTQEEKTRTVCHEGSSPRVQWCSLPMGIMPSRLDPAKNGHGHRVGSVDSRSGADEWQLEPPASSMVELLVHSNVAVSATSSNSNLDKQGVII
jgi:hypothetical protein